MDEKRFGLFVRSDLTHDWIWPGAGDAAKPDKDPDIDEREGEHLVLQQGEREDRIDQHQPCIGDKEEHRDPGDGDERKYPGADGECAVFIHGAIPSRRGGVHGNDAGFGGSSCQNAADTE